MHVLTVAKQVDVGLVVFTPDGTAVCAPADVGLALWDVATGQKRALTARGFRSGGSFCFHPSGRWSFGGFENGGLAVHDFTTGTNRTVSLGETVVGRVRVTPDGKTLVCYRSSATSHNRYTRYEWTATGALKLGWSVPTGTEEDAVSWSCGLEVLSDGKRFVTVERRVSFYPRLAVRSMATGEVISTALIYQLQDPILAVSPDDALLVVAVTARLYVFAAADFTTPLRSFRNDNEKHFTGIAFHPSGKYLAATSNDATVKLYDTSTWEVTRTFTWNIGRMRSIAFSPDGTLAAAGSDSGKVVVWDVDL